MDNLNVHKSEIARKLVTGKGCEYKFHPEYSPDLNPIEKMWSKVKQLLRGLKARSQNEVDGHGMEPMIPNGSVVGIKCNVPFRANEIYLAEIPYEGLVVKRVGVDLKNGEFIFKSENPDKEAYPDFRIPIAEAEKIIIGRVVWITVWY